MARKKDDVGLRDLFAIWGVLVVWTVVVTTIACVILHKVVD